MAKNSETLTKYKSAVTIVTADVANSWYGGLHGTSEANNLSENDPLVAGHIHDGQHLDGHAQKIDLVDHVKNQLRNDNIANSAVDKRTVNRFTNQADAIPEFEVINSTTYYYLDLSDLRSEISNSSGSFSYDDDKNIVIYNNSVGINNSTTSFVVGASDIEHDGENDNKFFFDVTASALRAGTVTDSSWDAENRGQNSFAWGLNTVASGDFAYVGGESNTVDAASTFSSILNGESNTITGSDYASIRNGLFNAIDSDGSFANVGGTGGRGYLYNQLALSGGYFDTDIDNIPNPKGQIQTSILVASTTITEDDVDTEMYLDQPTNSQKLFVPEKTTVVAKVTWVARTSSATAESSGGFRYFLLSRETAGVTIVDSSTPQYLNTEFGSDVYLDDDGIEGVVSIKAFTAGLPTHPTRISAKIEWTEIYLNN